MIKSKGIEFTVEVLTPSLDVLVVQGRCTQDLIKVGDIFESVYRYTPAKTLKDYGQPGERSAARPVRLRVESIQAYRHTLEELDPGLTAELYSSQGQGEKASKKATSLAPSYKNRLEAIAGIKQYTMLYIAVEPWSRGVAVLPPRTPNNIVS